MNMTSKLSLFLVLAIGLFSCTMVKSPQSASFHKVKYNPHLKFANKTSKEKLPETVSSFKEESAEESNSNEKAKVKPIQRLGSDFQNLTASVSSILAKPKSVEQKELETEVSKTNELSKSKTEPIFNSDFKIEKESNITSYLNSPAPVASDEALGDILYIILVVLLILIVISLIAELAGGLVGALIAVLLILLILRLLGYV